MGKDCLISIDVITRQASLDDMTKLFGVSPANSSHSKGGMRSPKRKWMDTLWRFDTGLGEGAPLADHWMEIKKRFPFKRLVKNDVPSDVSVFLNVGLFTRQSSTSMSLPSDLLRILGKYGVKVEISFYRYE